MDQLVGLLNNKYFDSYVMAAIRADLTVREIDWNTAEGRERFLDLLSFANYRMYRGSGKSSIGTHSTLLWHATRDPNETIALMSVNDDGAWAFCRQIRETMMSEIYQRFFPERIPDGDLSKLWTEKRIWVGGRNIPHPQWTIEARGFTSSWARTHFNRFFTDDLVTESNCNPTELSRIHRNLGNMRGLYMPLVRVWRHHLGTVYDERDDHWWLTKVKHCMSIVVPIEIYPDGAPDSVDVRGTPTNPEWHPLTEIEKIKSETVGDEGVLSYKRNFWLDPLAGVGDRIFTSRLLENRYKIVQVKVGAKYVQKMQRKGRNAKGEEVLVERDPFREMFRVLGVDPAFSTKKDADEWAISALGNDEDNIVCQLETVAGRGWEALKTHLRLMILKWEPDVVGYEKAAAQEQNFKTLLEYDSFYRRYKDIFLGVAHENQKKEARIIDQVREPLAAGKFLWHPNDTATRQEAIEYIPGPKARDNRLDSLAIGMSVIRRGRNRGDTREKFRRREQRIKSMLDPITHVKIR